MCNQCLTPRNEQVDSLANSAITIGRITNCAVPASDYFPVYKHLLFQRWQSFWSSLSCNKLQTIKPSICPWSDPRHKIRRWETALARLRLGHTRLTHSFLMSRSPKPCCPTCKTALSVSHILLDCPQYAQARLTSFPFLTHLSRPPSLIDILGETTHFSITNIMSFLQHINLLHTI